MNNMYKKFCMCMISGILAVSGAFADDTPGVVERTDCNATNAEISVLSAIANPTEDEVARLSELQSVYRRDCVVRGVRRRASGRSVDATAQSVAVTDMDAVQSVDATLESDAAPEQPTLSAEEIAANINAGLCADGAYPNRFGCCSGEKFKDLGNLEFACCRDDGECFPPMK